MHAVLLIDVKTHLHRGWLCHSDANDTKDTTLIGSVVLSGQHSIHYYKGRQRPEHPGSLQVMRRDGTGKSAKDLYSHSWQEALCKMLVIHVVPCCKHSGSVSVKYHRRQRWSCWCWSITSDVGAWKDLMPLGDTQLAKDAKDLSDGDEGWLLDKESGSTSLHQRMKRTTWSDSAASFHFHSRTRCFGSAAELRAKRWPCCFLDVFGWSVGCSFSAGA